MDLPRERRRSWLKEEDVPVEKRRKKGEEKRKREEMKKKGEREGTRVGAPVKRNIVHAPARRNICLLSVHALGRVRFLLWYRRLPSFPFVLCPLSALSLSLFLRVFSFFAAS